MIRTRHTAAHAHRIGRLATVDRAEAARLLRAARSAAPHALADSVEWVSSVMPDSFCARRLKIELLLEQGDAESADALIAQGLLLRPTNAAMSLLRARSFCARGEFDRADRELRLVLSKRPHHFRALELAGQVALRLGDPQRAAHFFERADRRRPNDQIKGLRVAALLQAGRPDLARTVLQRIQTPTPLLHARLLRAEGRLLEATETLHEAGQDEQHPEYEAIMCELIDLLEHTADFQQLRHVLEPIEAEHPTVLARAGLAWLGMGAFRTAALRMAKLARVAGYHAAALTVLLVAAAMINRPTLAERVLQRLRRSNEPVDTKAVAEAWCRGLLGRLLLDQQSARKAGADPHTGRLQQLLRDAAKAFDQELTASGQTLSHPQWMELKQHRAVCRHVSAQFDDAPSGWRAGDPGAPANPHATRTAA